MTTPRFSFPEPARKSVGDRLLETAEQLKITLVRNEDGDAVLAIQLEASVGADLFTEGGFADRDEQRSKSAAGVSLAGQLIRAFAGKDGGE